MPMARPEASQPNTPTAVASMDWVTKAWLGIGIGQSVGGRPVLSSSDWMKAFRIPRAGHRSGGACSRPQKRLLFRIPMRSRGANVKSVSKAILGIAIFTLPES